MTNQKKRKSRKSKVILHIKSELAIPAEILPWELDLLAAVLKAAEETQHANACRTETTR